VKKQLYYSVFLAVVILSFLYDVCARPKTEPNESCVDLGAMMSLPRAMSPYPPWCISQLTSFLWVSKGIGCVTHRYVEESERFSIEIRMRGSGR